jgi:hypothetical protein
MGGVSRLIDTEGGLIDEERDRSSLLGPRGATKEDVPRQRLGQVRLSEAERPLDDYELASLRG